MSNLHASLTPSPTARESITDAVLRACLALDTDDLALFRSAFTDDSSLEVTGISTSQGFDAIKKDCFDTVAKLDTTHFLSNFRVNVEGTGNTAKLTCSAHSFHYRKGEGLAPGAPKFVGGTLYWVDLVRDEGDGLWKMSKWFINPVWLDGDRSVMTPPA